MFRNSGINLRGMKWYLSLIFAILFVAPAKAKKYHYQYTENCNKAYNFYMSLQPEQGKMYIRKELIADPYNLMATYISDYEDCLLLLFNGSKLDYEQLKGHLNARITLMERGDENSPWHRLCKAGIYMHWAFVNIRFNDNFKAAANFRKSYLLLRENKRLFPNFEYNNIFLGIEEATIGALPDNYKWIVSVLGMKGNLKEGVNKVGRFLDNHDRDDMLFREAEVYYVYMNYYLLSDKQKAWSLVSNTSFDVKTNLVNAFVKANVALNYRKAAEAIEVLQQASYVKGYERYPIFEYELGYALLHKLDEKSISHFNVFLKNYHGKIFVKDCYQKLAYAYYLKGDEQTAGYCRNKIKGTGSAVTDSDKQAQRFAEETGWPNKHLLKAQLLTDGGYYKEAYSLISNVEIADFKTTGEQLEYYFRLARVQDELGRTDAATNYYNKAIEMGKNRQEQFGARAALQLGFLYEKLRKNDAARNMFQLALSMKNHDFQNSIDQQAKAGINRLNNQ